MFKKYYLGGFFWVPTSDKRYQNTSGFAGDHTFNGFVIVEPFSTFSYCKVKDKRVSDLIYTNLAIVRS